MYPESDLLPISALQHLLFCPRQCGLIHIERIWLENRFTAEGRILHERSHAPGSRRKGPVRIEYAVPLRSLRLGLSGVADVVEFHAGEDAGTEEAPLPGQERGLESLDSGAGTGPNRPLSGQERGPKPYPVEYKRGAPKRNDSDLVQLCAQALCLEEMLGVHIPEGSLFYGQERRRTRVAFTESLRKTTEQTAMRLHEIVSEGVTPPAQFGKKCEACSLMDACLPRQCSGRGLALRYLDEILEEA